MIETNLFLRLALALAIGFVIGLERGWHERDEVEGQRTAGIRTFSLIGLLGGVFGALGDMTLLAAGFVTVGAALAAFMWREGEQQNDFSATSLIAAMLAFALGALAMLGDMRLAAGAGVAAVILLANKEVLHEWLTRLTWGELRAGLLLAAMTFIALPLLPDRAIDPWDALNPHELWLMTILIAAVSFAGYAAVKFAGPERGLMLAAVAGGLVASTAVTLALARLARNNAAHVKLLAGGISGAGAVMLVRVGVIAGVINLPLMKVLAPTLGAGAITMALLAFLLARAGSSSGADSKGLEFTNPLELAPVLRFGALLTAITLAVAVARHFFGNSGLFTLAALAGLADVDAMTLAAAKLSEPISIAATAILLTATVNSLAKAAYAWFAGGTRIGLLVLGVTAAAIAAAAAVWFYLP
jgi:uncharacterized membrane protein (DUF4010 family)